MGPPLNRCQYERVSFESHHPSYLRTSYLPPSSLERAFPGALQDGLHQRVADGLPKPHNIPLTVWWMTPLTLSRCKVHGLFSHAMTTLNLGENLRTGTGFLPVAIDVRNLLRFYSRKRRGWRGPAPSNKEILKTGILALRLARIGLGAENDLPSLQKRQ